MTKRSALVLCAALALGVSACKDQTPAPSGPPDAPPVKKVIMPVREPPADAPAAAVDATASTPDGASRAEVKPSGSKVGVAVCDEYLDKMARCTSRLSPEAQVPMKNAMQESRKAWQANAATPEGKAALDGTCRQALDAAKSAAAAMGCEW